MYQSCRLRKSRRDHVGLSTVYQKTCPTPVASGPSAGAMPAGSVLVTRLMRSRTRARAKYKSMLSSKTT